MYKCMSFNKVDYPYLHGEARVFHEIDKSILLPVSYIDGADLNSLQDLKKLTNKVVES